MRWLPTLIVFPISGSNTEIDGGTNFFFETLYIILSGSSCINNFGGKYKIYVEEPLAKYISTAYFKMMGGLNLNLLYDYTSPVVQVSWSYHYNFWCKAEKI